MDLVPGRAAELALLDSACQDVRRGSGRLVLITGEAGIGKTRLTQAVWELADSEGMARARGWCMDDPGAPTLWLWRRVARDVAGLGAALDLEREAEVDDDYRFRLGERVASTLASNAATSGLVLILEDIHWADSLSLAVLRRLLPEVIGMPLLLVATARENGLADSVLGRLLPDLLRSPSTVTITLAGLSAGAVAGWLGGDPRTAAWEPYAEELVARTGGNPLFIRSLTEEAQPRSGLEVASALVERPTWRTVLVAPYRSLGDVARRTVATAAVLGERLSPQLLAHALDRDVHAVSAELADAVTAGILHFGDTGLAFKHALVRDAIVAELDPAERERAHMGAAMALEATGDPMLVGPAAVHWSRVDGPSAAARCRDLATHAATAQVLAPESGIELARLALASARRLHADDGEIAEHLVAVTRFAWAAGRMQEALESCAEALALAEAAGRPDVMADAALVPQGVGSVDVAQLVGQMCVRTLRVLPKSEGTRRARLLALSAASAAEAAQSPPSPGDPPVGRSPDELSAEALASARASGDLEAELETIAARHYVLSYPQTITERTALAARAVELAPTATTSMGALWGHLWQADLGFQRGDLLAVRQSIADVERVADRRSSPVARWHALRLTSALAALVGSFDEARQAAAEARLIADRVGDIAMMGMHHAFHVQLATLRGDPTDLLPDVLEVLQSAPPIPLVQAALPLVHTLLGDLDAARSAFIPLRGIPTRMPLGPRWVGTVGQIGFAAVVVGDADVARECHRLLLPCRSWCGGDGGGSPFALGSAQTPLGQLAQTFGDLPLAAGHFDRGIAVDDRIGAAPYAALGRLGLAECLSSADPCKARAVVTQAVVDLERLSMPGPLARAKKLADRLAAGPGRGERPGGLSARELEVARLLAQALTNQQIADQLFLSVRTVESHVRSTLAKLGLTNRTEIVLWVRDEDL
jgi:DNA-binding CsgD family transcriptional regulator